MENGPQAGWGPGVEGSEEVHVGGQEEATKEKSRLQQGALSTHCGCAGLDGTGSVSQVTWPLTPGEAEHQTLSTENIQSNTEGTQTLWVKEDRYGFA